MHCSHPERASTSAMAVTLATSAEVVSFQPQASSSQRAAGSDNISPSNYIQERTLQGTRVPTSGKSLASKKDLQTRPNLKEEGLF